MMLSDTKPVTLAELETDPFGLYRRLRREQPVARIDELNQWLVTRWADVDRVLGDAELFTTDMPGAPMIRYCGGVPMLLREGDSHRDVREAFVHDYAPHRVGDYTETIVRPHAERVVAELKPRGHAELAKQYFELVAALSEATLIGIDCAGTRVAWWAGALQNAAVNFDADPAVDAAAMAASSDISAVVTPTLERLRKQPDETVLSHMLHHDRPPSQPREYGDVLPVLKHVILSVTEPAWLASGTLLALLQHPAQLAEVRTHRRLLGQAVYEGLRWLSPVGAIARRTTRPVTLGELRLPADTVLAVSIASANHDENVFDEPEAFDIHRNAQPHFALGEGAHVCAAKAFVPAVARTALDVLFDRLPGLQLAVGDGRADPSGWKFRFPRELHATW